MVAYIRSVEIQLTEYLNVFRGVGALEHFKLLHRSLTEYPTHCVDWWVGSLGAAMGSGAGSRDFRERLIEEVRRWPALYDAAHDLHRDIDERERCWQHVASALGATNSEILKREWKILRDSLRQSMKKRRVDGTTKAGLPRKAWRFQGRMAFLLPHMSKRVSSSVKEEIYVGVPDEMDIEVERTETGTEEATVRDNGRTRGGGGGGGGSEDSLELFFASVCTAARALSAGRRARLTRDVLRALHRAEDPALPDY